jgi:hypothetical protein
VASDLYRNRANCPECVKIKRREINHSKEIPFIEMLKRFRESYGEKFSYDETSYQGGKELMKVHCNDCNADFEISPIHHLKYNNGGCPNCHLKRTAKCSKCGKEIEVDRHVGPNFLVYCDECKSKYCKICGRILNSDSKCSN